MRMEPVLDAQPTDAAGQAHAELDVEAPARPPPPPAPCLPRPASQVGWTRSSRTDKSVHSVSTVVALKLEVEPDMFDTDPEGQALCAAINAHLPPQVRCRLFVGLAGWLGCLGGASLALPCLDCLAAAAARAPAWPLTRARPADVSAGSHPPSHLQIRVFSIQRVSNSWSARSECIRRRCAGAGGRGQVARRALGASRAAHACLAPLRSN